MQIELKIKPLSVNEAWLGSRVKSHKYRLFERDLLFLLPIPKKPFSDMIRLELFFGFSSKNSDLSNPLKLVEDVLQKKYGFNDNKVYEINLRKCIVPKGQEFISIGIYPYLPL